MLFKIFIEKKAEVYSTFDSSHFVASNEIFILVP